MHTNNLNIIVTVLQGCTLETPVWTMKLTIILPAARHSVLLIFFLAASKVRMSTRLVSILVLNSHFVSGDNTVRARKSVFLVAA